MSTPTTAINQPLMDDIWNALELVPDPEIPTISVVDLGIITGVEVGEDERIRITMTPTFSGCPAINFMRQNVETKIKELLPGRDVTVTVDFKTQWSTNRITDKGRGILKDFGLAPPKKYSKEYDASTVGDAKCPFCNSENTSLRSPFGPTLCRALHFCYDCRQGFEQFKPL